MTAQPQWATEGPPEPRSADGKPLSKRGAATRRALLDAGEQVFGSQGWYDASVVKITEAAGVAQGTFYRYFPSKQALFDEVVVDLNRRVRQAMSAGAADGTTRAQRERGGFEGFFAFIAEHPALYRIIRQAEFASPNALHLHYERIARGYVKGLREAMDDDQIGRGDPDALAWALMGIGELVGMRWILWGEQGAVPSDVLDEVMAFITRGLGAGNGSGVGNDPPAAAGTSR
ncbi:TetR/AcrR family transcriptional regulator [soil metagenome]